MDAVVIGISTGGPQALKFLIPQLPADFPVPLAIARWSLHDIDIPAALPLAACAVAAALGVCLALSIYFRRRIGGYTGDCLGATQQLAELAILLVMLASVIPPARIG